MGERPRNMSFAAIFISVCRGVKDFPRLMNMSPVRVVLHLFFLSFLMAMLITVSRSLDVFSSINQLCDGIQQQCGDFVMDANGLRPELAPNKPKTIFAADCSLRYFPDDNFDLKVIKKDIGNVGVIWTPGIMVLWIRLANKHYSAVPLIYPVFQGRWGANELAERLNEMSDLTIGELTDYIRTKGNPQGEFNVNFTHGSIEVIRPAIKIYAATIIFIAFLGQIFFQALFFIGIYSIIFSFIGGGEIKALKFRQIFAVGSYCAFPAIFIASFFPAFQLQFDYQTVFLLAFLIYLVVVFNFLQRVLLERTTVKFGQGEH